MRVRVRVRVRVRARVRAGYACRGLLARPLLLDPCGGEEGLKLLEAHGVGAVCVHPPEGFFEGLDLVKGDMAEI